ncbi:LacI family transcriptional regulator [Devosia geojensis]|uniref:LacI family transcriptional regulator n=1 Tax=Devosia geojensis TaxID=443610 RepID=A0A0F5FY27_9HYPH|nr:LacI family DNA-binding transcriptional regulator [Devosia geojensis]KKB13480.1 LacI family transcriptional regulator [Devosia geojensis]
MTSQSHTSTLARKRPATIIDVAQAAGVAVGTVSRHLNGLPVRAGNRDQIERAIAALGYRRNSTAVAMKTDTTHIVGFLVPSLGEFHAAMLEKLSRKMRLTGRAVLSFCHDLQPASIREGLEFFASHRVDALVLDGEEAIRHELTPYIEDGLVVVLYDNDIPGLPVDRVLADNRRASARAVAHLLDLGHKRVATLHGNLRDSAGRERLAGFHDAHAAHGVPPDPALIVDADWQEIRGYEGVRELFSLPDPPTALFSANYNMTLGILTYLHEVGMQVPRDLSLISFDDVPALRLHNPGITAVAQPIEEVAQTITGIIDKRLSDPAAMGRHDVRIDCNIILRDSTRRLA